MNPETREFWKVFCLVTAGFAGVSLLSMIFHPVAIAMLFVAAAMVIASRLQSTQAAIFAIGFLLIACITGVWL